MSASRSALSREIGAHDREPNGGVIAPGLDHGLNPRLGDHEHGPAEHAPFLDVVAETLKLGAQEPGWPPSFGCFDRDRHTRSDIRRTLFLYKAAIRTGSVRR